mgnify:FL=1
MLYEVELKFRLDNNERIESELVSLGAVHDAPIEQVDYYFNHPARDFRVTDEAFRIRSVGTQNCVTYKGPVVDPSTKMRHEIEVGIADGSDAVGQMADLLQQLGFRSFLEVRKSRTPGHLVWNDRRYELAMDAVPSVGTFLEIELVVDEALRNEARDAILALASRLQLTQPERRSYLELVIAQDAIKGA